ncbi:hypothetical protein Cflav_PD5479 [Pedosphaera parvula Ellin514]|uniref:Uncharacterized protein n=1 Tax=Pedosphaera parvula (strain Ellin514) TaxID=320771 RepID=B9XBF9_PEDPL|nr:hypothetical protein Cflav_PD5479 [Pedosphaera parvula Ellin514]
MGAPGKGARSQPEPGTGNGMNTTLPKVIPFGGAASAGDASPVETAPHGGDMP